MWAARYGGACCKPALGPWQVGLSEASLDHKKMGMGRKGINTGEGYIKINILKTVIGKNSKVYMGRVHMN